MTDSELTAEIASSARRWLRDRWPLDDGRLVERVDPGDVRAVRKGVGALGWEWIARGDGAPDALPAAPALVGLFTELGRHPAPIAASDVAVWYPLLACADEGQLLAPYIELDSAESVLAVATGGQSGEPIWDGVTVQGQLATGTKAFVPYLDVADTAVVSATIDGQPGFVLVDLSAGGVSVETMQSYDRLDRPGMLLLERASVTTICRGESAQSVGDVGRALSMITVGAELVGLAAAAVELTVEYVKTRTQFGRPIGSFQAIKHLLAEAWIDVYTAESAVRRAAHAIPAATTVPDAAAAAELALAVTIPAARRALESSLQAHGGIGFTLEYRLSWYFNRMMSRSCDYSRVIAPLSDIGHRALAEHGQVTR